MKVILLKDIRGMGSKGVVKDVSDGYARNFLLPQKLAEAATAEKLQEFEDQKAARVEQTRLAAEQLDKKVAALHGKEVDISARATEKGGLFKSITAPDIVKAIRAKHSLEISEDAVHTATPIKTIGEHTAVLKSANNSIELKITVTATL